MNRTFLIFLMVGTALMIAVIGRDDIDHSVSTMPWNVQVLDSGSTRVFDITLGKTNIQDAHQILANFSETRLFSTDDKLELRAHFDELSLAGLIAEIDLVYDLPPEKLVEIQQQAINTEHGNYQLISEQMLMDLLNTPIKQLIYKPGIDYDNTIVSQRFGAAKNREAISETVEKLSFPEIGLVIYLDAQGPEHFIYSQISKTNSTEY